MDAVGILTGQPYQRLKEEGANELLTNHQQRKIGSVPNGKHYAADVATTEQLLRISQKKLHNSMAWYLGSLKLRPMALRIRTETKNTTIG